MSTLFPAAKDDSSTLPNPSSGNYLNSPDHTGLHGNANDAVKAVETKLGTGSSAPASNTLLLGTGAGTSSWTAVTSSQLAGVLSDETGSGSAVFATTPTLVTPKVDTINEATGGNGTTIGGVNIKSGALVTSNSVVTANVTDSAITPAKLLTGTGSSWVWQTWSPTVASGLSIGNATYNSRYVQMGKTIICDFRVIFGSTTTFSGGLVWNLPVTAKTASGATYIAFGIAQAQCNGSVYQFAIRYVSTTTFQFEAWVSSGAYITTAGVTNAVPSTWQSATTDTIGGTFVYEAV